LINLTHPWWIKVFISFFFLFFFNLTDILLWNKFLLNNVKSWQYLRLYRSAQKLKDLGSILRHWSTPIQFSVQRDLSSEMKHCSTNMHAAFFKVDPNWSAALCTANRNTLAWDDRGRLILTFKSQIYFRLICSECIGPCVAHNRSVVSWQDWCLMIMQLNDEVIICPYLLPQYAIPVKDWPELSLFLT